MLHVRARRVHLIPRWKMRSLSSSEKRTARRPARCSECDDRMADTVDSIDAGSMVAGSFPRSTGPAAPPGRSRDQSQSAPAIHRAPPAHGQPDRGGAALNQSTGEAKGRPRASGPSCASSTGRRLSACRGQTGKSFATCRIDVTPSIRLLTTRSRTSHKLLKISPKGVLRPVTT